MITFSSSSVPNALAALLLAVRDNTHRLPHIYFEWTEGNPAVNLLRFLFFGVGEVAPLPARSSGVLNLIAIAALMSTLDESCALKTHHSQAVKAQNLDFRHDRDAFRALCIRQLSDQATDLRENGWINLMTARVRQFDHLGTTLGQLTRQQFGHLRRDHRVSSAIGNDCQGAAQIRGRRFGKGHHRCEQYRTGEDSRPPQHHRRSNIGAIGESHCDQRAVVNPVRTSATNSAVSTRLNSSDSA